MDNCHNLSCGFPQAQSLEKITYKKILRKWPTHKNVWKNANPAVVLRHRWEFGKAIEKATSEHAELLADMAESGIADLEIAVIKNEHASAEDVKKIHEKYGNRVHLLLAKHPNASPEVLTELSKSTEYGIRRDTADNPNTPVEVLECLAQDEDRWVRGVAVKSKKLSPDFLRRMNHKWRNDGIASSIASNPNTPMDILENLATWGNWETHQSLIFNPAFNEELAKKVLKRCCDKIERLMVECRLIPLSLIIEKQSKEPKKWDRDLASQIVCHPDVTPEILGKLAEHESDTVHEYVARNPKTPPEALVRLAKSNNKFVREYVASHPNTPEELALDLQDEIEDPEDDE